METPVTILNVSGPYREPREPAFSYDYSIQRSSWPTLQGVRVKVSIADELDYLRSKVLGVSGGSPGQQLLVTQMLSRRIADRKFQIAGEEGMFSERRDVMIGPFTGDLGHLFARLEIWMNEARSVIREEIRQKVGL
ncbi:MAG: hypothetical protein ACREI2_13265 [Nitrospiraceae bacterium]